jgi:hypothetical protein
MNNDILKEQLILLELPQDAIAWLMSLYDVIQGFDDVKDNGKLDDKQLYELIFSSMVLMPTNEFYLNNIVALSHLVNLQILKWIASNKLEQDGQANTHSFMWRAGYFDIVLHVVFLCKGFNFAKDNAHLILSIYGEKLDDYLKEFEVCQT